MALVAVTERNILDFKGNGVFAKAIGDKNEFIKGFPLPGFLSNNYEGDIGVYGKFPIDVYIGELAPDVESVKNIQNVDGKYYAKVKLRFTSIISGQSKTFLWSNSKAENKSYTSLWFWVDTLSVENGNRAIDSQGFNTPVYCNANGVSFRDIAKTSGKQLTQFSQGQLIGYTDSKVVNGGSYVTLKGSGSTWYKIKRDDNGSFGYVAKPFVAFKAPATRRSKTVRNSDGSVTIEPDVVATSQESYFKYGAIALGLGLLGWVGYKVFGKRIKQVEPRNKPKPKKRK